MAEGRVFLVGAGPGDPGLLTLRGRELLQQADVVVYDYLIHTGLLDVCRPECERICVGKRPGFHAIAQEEIEKLLVKLARAGKRVVRLKGGDPFIFGRGGEEARQLAADKIPFEIVPGVTASLAAGAYSGIPLTHRDIASTVVFATGHEDPAKTAVKVDWRALGALEHATLCIYMGMAHLPEILLELRAGCLAADTPAACVQWASLGRQRTIVATVATLAGAVQAAGLTSPAIVVIGEVVRYREAIAWFEQRPLLGRRVAVTRNREQAGELRAKLEHLGASVLELPLVKVSADVNPEIRAEIFAELGSYDWLVFSSANGVRHFFDALVAEFGDLRALGLIRIAAVGQMTAEAIRELRLRVDVVPEKPVAEELARALIENGSLDSSKVLLVTGNQGRDVLVKMLEDARAIVDRFPVYRTEQTELGADPVAQDFRAHGADAVLFTSSSGVRSFADQAGALALADGAQRPLAGSIGPVTSETMRGLGMKVDFESATSTLDALVAAAVKKLGTGVIKH